MTETKPTGARRPGFIKTYLVPLLFVVFHMGMIYIVTRIAMQVKPDAGLNSQTLLSITIACAIVAPVTYYFLKKRAQRRPATLMTQKTTGDDWIQTVGWSLIGINVARLVIIAFALLATAIAPLQAWLERYMGLSEILAGEEVPLTLLIFATTLVGPLAEELVYRGAVMGAFRDAMSERWAIVLSALVFGIVHMDFIQSTYAFVLGLMLGYVYHLTQSIWCAYVMHLIINFLGGPLTKIVGADSEPLKAGALVIVTFILGVLGIVMVTVNNSKRKKEAYLQRQREQDVSNRQ